ncbi:MAG: hypothetical protein V1745_04180 [Patescibacteria group bacterium]
MAGGTIMSRKSSLLLAVSMLFASMTVLGCDNGETTTNTSTGSPTGTTTTTSSTPTTSDGGSAGSGAVAGSGGQGGSPAGGSGGQPGGSGGDAGTGGDPATGGSGGEAQGGAGGATTTTTTDTTSTTTTDTTTTSSTDTTSTTTDTTTTSTTDTTTTSTTTDQGGAGGVGGSGGIGGEAQGGAGGVTTTTTTDTTSTTTDTTSTTTDTTTTSTTDTTSTSSTTSSDGGAGGFGGGGGTGGAGGGSECPAWQPGPGLTCGTWTSHTDPDLAAMNLVWGGQALSETDVFVVGGTYGAGKIVRYDGNDWIDQTIPDTSSLSNVLVLSPTEAYAVGKGAMWDFDCVMLELTSGSTWSTVAGTPTLGSYWGCSDLWAESSSDMFLLATDTGDSKIFRGPKQGPWIEMPIPLFADDFRLEEVWGTSASDVYAVGYLTVGGNPSAGILLHYDGNVDDEWVLIPMDASILMLTSVSGSGPCGIAVTGMADNEGVNSGVNVYFDGNTWSAPSILPSVSDTFGIAHVSTQQVVVAGVYREPEAVGKFGTDDGSRGITWESPLVGHGYVRNVVPVPNSDVIYALVEQNGASVMATWCN